MTRWRAASIGALVALTAGCASQHENVGSAPTLGPGWQCLATASELDAPGTILRRDERSGAIVGMVDLSQQIGIQSEERPVGFVTSQIVTPLALAANLLRLGKGVTAAASANPPKTYTVSADYKDARKEVTSDPEADRARKWFATYPARETGFSYFLIREALVVKDATYTLGSDLIADLGGEAAVSRQVTVALPNDQPNAAPAALDQYTTIPLSGQGDARLEWHKSASEPNPKRPYVLQMSFARPQHVCFKAERLVRTNGATSYDLVPVETPLDISSYEPMQ